MSRVSKSSKLSAKSLVIGTSAALAFGGAMASSPVTALAADGDTSSEGTVQEGETAAVTSATVDEAEAAFYDAMKTENEAREADQAAEADLAEKQKDVDAAQETRNKAEDALKDTYADAEADVKDAQDGAKANREAAEKDAQDARDASDAAEEAATKAEDAKDAADDELADAKSAQQDAEKAAADANVTEDSVAEAKKASEDASNKANEAAKASEAAQAAANEAQKNLDGAEATKKQADEALDFANDVKDAADQDVAEAQKNLEEKQAAYDKAVDDAAAEHEQLKKELEDAQATLKDKQDAQKAAETAVSDAEAAVKAADDDVQAKQEALDKANAELKSKQEAEADAQKKKDDAAKAAEEAEAAFDKAQADQKAQESDVKDKKAAKENADKAVTNAEDDVKDAEAASAAANKAVEEAQKAVDAAKEQVAKGSVGFFQEEGDTVAAGYLLDQESIEGSTQTTFWSHTDLGGETDATNLKNMLDALDWIDYCNEIRASVGLAALKVSDGMMASAQRNANFSTYKYQHARDEYNSMGMAETRNRGGAENLYFTGIGVERAYKGWYSEEKAFFDEAWASITKQDASAAPTGAEAYSWYLSNNSAVENYLVKTYPHPYFPGESKYSVGHYTNLICPDYTVTGIGLNSTVRNGAALQQFLTENPYNPITTYTISAYRDRLQAYYDKYVTSVSEPQLCPCFVMSHLRALCIFWEKSTLIESASFLSAKRPRNV